jgi:hypothetical protein
MPRSVALPLRTCTMLTFACNALSGFGRVFVVLWKILLAFIAQSWWPFLLSLLECLQILVVDFWRLWTCLFILLSFCLLLFNLSLFVKELCHGLVESFGIGFFWTLVGKMLFGSAKSSFVQLAASNSTAAILLPSLPSLPWHAQAALDIFRIVKPFLLRLQASSGFMGVLIAVYQYANF